MNIYLDTVAAYTDYPKYAIQRNPNVHWNKTVKQMGNQTVTSHWVRDNDITLRVYDQLYGASRLFMSTSIAGLDPDNIYHNYWYGKLSNIPIIVDSMKQTIGKHILTPTAIDPLSFQLSRADLFFMHPVPPSLKPYVLDALGQMGGGQFKSSTFENTRYISCKLIFDTDNEGNRRVSSVVVRIYCKDREVFTRYYPEAVYEDFEHHRYTEYTHPHYIRIETSYTRDAIVYRLGGKGNTTPRQANPGTTLGALLLDPVLQTSLINQRFDMMGFYEQCHPTRRLTHRIEAVCKTDKVYRNALELIDALRKDKPPNLTPDEVRTVRELLQANLISLVPSGIKGQSLPPVDRNVLLAQNAVYVEAPSDEGC
jgi:hypothetical protein